MYGMFSILYRNTELLGWRPFYSVKTGLGLVVLTLENIREVGKVGKLRFEEIKCRERYCMDKNSIMKYVVEHFDNTNSVLPETLPLMHSCDGFDCEKIIQDIKLKPTMCNIFKEELLYFFYGKPSYPIGEKERYNRTDALCCPVCFIVDIEKVDIYKVFPFDTGAFKNGMYNQFIHRHMHINEFEIDNNSRSIRAYISVVFGNNENYLKGNSIQKEVDNTYVNSLLRMLSAKGAFEIDERSNTIEVICKSAIDISKEVTGIILPENLKRKKGVSDFIEDYNIKCKTYEVRNMTAPTRYNEVVFQLAVQLGKEEM